jgi:hypothetical protein
VTGVFVLPAPEGEQAERREPAPTAQATGHDATS